MTQCVANHRRIFIHPRFLFGENSHNHIMTNDLQVSGKREKIKKERKEERKKEKPVQASEESSKKLNEH